LVADTEEPVHGPTNDQTSFCGLLFVERQIMNSQHTIPLANCVEKNKLTNLLAWRRPRISAPQKTILLVSKSKELQHARAQVL
jgi:hypothetical protein